MVGPPREAPDRRRGRNSRLSGGEATAASADWPVPVPSEGRAWRRAAVPGAEARGVALGARRAALGGRGGRPASSGLRGAGPAAPRTPGNRSEGSGACLPGCGAATARGGLESGRPELKRDQACRRLLPGGEVSSYGNG